jgi:hypothetical protein
MSKLRTGFAVTAAAVLASVAAVAAVQSSGSAAAAAAKGAPVAGLGITVPNTNVDLPPVPPLRVDIGVDQPKARKASAPHPVESNAARHHHGKGWKHWPRSTRPPAAPTTGVL